MSITQRQAQILAAIVKEYSYSGHPVGSEELAAKHHFKLSPASIRNEMQALEEEELILQPHTSAGRVPTDKGYRYFINKLMHHIELSAKEQFRLRAELSRLKNQYLELGRSISKLLSQAAEGAAFALLPESTGTSGLAKVMGQDVEPREAREVATFLDELEQYGQLLTRKDIDAVETFIGHESPVPRLSDFSLVVKRVSLPHGKKGLIGVVGPKRMKYARNISILEYISKLVSGGLGILIISNF